MALKNRGGRQLKMWIERRGVVGFLEVQTTGGARNVVDDHELTGKFYEQTKDWIADSAPPALRNASQLYQKKSLSNQHI